MRYGLVLFENGLYKEADVQFSKACKIMDTFVGEGKLENRAIFISESYRPYRGSPYERATAYFYRGLCLYHLKKYDIALAAFKRSISSDSETSTDNPLKQKDFNISYFMAAMCYAMLNEYHNAINFLSIGKDSDPNNPIFNEDILNNNLFIIFATGDGPRIEFSELSFAMTKIEKGNCPEANIKIYSDNKLLGEAVKTTDLLFQAKSNNLSKQHAAKAQRYAVKKGALCLLAMVAISVGQPGSANTFMNANPEISDIKCWKGLPNYFFVFSDKLELGEHNLHFKFFDKDKNELKKFEISKKVTIKNEPLLLTVRTKEKTDDIVEKWEKIILDTVELSIPKIVGRYGSVIKVPFKINHVDNLAGIKLSIEYDNSVLKYKKIRKSDNAKSLMHTVNDKNDGKLIIVAAGAKGISLNDQSIFELHFKISKKIESPQITTLNITDGELMTEKLINIPYRTKPLNINLSPH